MCPFNAMDAMRWGVSHHATHVQQVICSYDMLGCKQHVGMLQGGV